MVHTALLTTHILVGTAALLVGPLAMRDDLRRFAAGTATTGTATTGTGTTGPATTGRLTTAYTWLVLAVCLTAAALVVGYRADLWWLVPVSALTYGLALLARASETRRHPGWTHGYVHGIGGSYIALVTALIVVALTVDGPVTGPAQLIPWLAPTVIGTPLIEVWRRRLLAALPGRTGDLTTTSRASR